MTSQPYSPAPIFPELGDGFADPVDAAMFDHHILRFRNDRAAADIGLDSLSDEDWIRHFGQFEPLAGNLPNPLAQRYHGHQFRVYNPDIGDGRGFLFAQMRDHKGRVMDLGTKGSGVTPYSRSGDGRLTLKGGVREIMASEMLEALGAYTSRTFSLIETGEKLWRGDEPSPTRSAVMVRLTHGHIRIGTFQRHAYEEQTERLTKLTDYCLHHYYGEEPKGSPADRALLFLNLVAEKVAEQAADLMATGYVHGVLNTDNINITGEIFDFGPWRLLPVMDPSFTAAYFDETGLYAFGRQPDALQWNLYQLAGSLLALAEEEALRAVLEPFPDLFRTAMRARMLKRLGVKSIDSATDQTLLDQVNRFMATEKFPFERFFFDTYGGRLSVNRVNDSPHREHYSNPAYSELFALLGRYEPIRETALEHAYFQKEAPCTLLIEDVESLWSHIAEADNWAPLTQKLAEIDEMRSALA